MPPLSWISRLVEVHAKLEVLQMDLENGEVDVEGAISELKEVLGILDVLVAEQP